MGIVDVEHFQRRQLHDLLQTAVPDIGFLELQPRQFWHLGHGIQPCVADAGAGQVQQDHVLAQRLQLAELRVVDLSVISSRVIFQVGLSRHDQA